MNIRRYVEGDHPEVLDLHERALRPTGTLIPGPWDEDRDHIREQYLEAGGEFLVGTVGDRIVAMGALRRVSEDVAELKRMRVEPRWQRRGLGSELLRRLEERARQLGYRVLKLDTVSENTGARRFYEGRGYRQTGTTEAGPFELVLYAKKLA